MQASNFYCKDWVYSLYGNSYTMPGKLQLAQTNLRFQTYV